MYFAILVKQSDMNIAYGKYLPQDISKVGFAVGIGLGCILAFMFLMGILIVTRVRHCIITCPVSNLFYFNLTLLNSMEF